MSLNNLFKGKKVRKQLGYNKSVILTIADIKENVHRDSRNQPVFKNYTVKYTNGEVEHFNSLEKIDFCTPLLQKITNIKNIRR